MTTPTDPLLSLRKALNFSPDNIPLRQHLADLLLDRGEAIAATSEYQQALVLDPQNPDLQLGLARAYDLTGQDVSTLTIVADRVAGLDRQQAQELERLLATIDDPELVEGVDVDRDDGFARFIAYPDGAELVDRVGVDRDDVFDRFGNYTEENPDIIDLVGADPVNKIERFIPYPNGNDLANRSFADVGGLEDLKEEIRLKIIYPLTHTDLYRTYGKSLSGGILLYGPPGCGKTHLAKATAGEIQAEFITVGLNDMLDLWIGNSEKKLRQIFDRARQQQPCILFFDELDALIENRAGANNSTGRKSIEQFLIELDALHDSNDLVFVIAATNAPWHLDETLHRPGRFDRVLLVPPPDISTRATILRLLCQGKPISEIDYQLLSQKTEGCSGADLKSIVDLAVEQKLVAAMKTGIPQPLHTNDLVAAASGLKRNIRKWFSTAGNHSNNKSIVRIFHR
jgi:transitional endoplasmic reticulum ATPase